MHLTETFIVDSNYKTIISNIIKIYNITDSSGILDELYSASEKADIQNSMDTLQMLVYDLTNAMARLSTYEVDIQDGLRYPPIQKASVAHNALKKSPEIKNNIIVLLNDILSLYLDVSTKLIPCK